MHWKVKSLVQNAIALLPSSASYTAYYWFQRHLGGLRRTDPTGRLAAAVRMWSLILEDARVPNDKIFFEVGTGRAPILPLAFWLLGARGTITMDLNPYLKVGPTNETLQYLADHRDEVERMFGSFLDRARLDDVLRLHRSVAFSMEALLNLCRITYIAPGNAASTGLADESVDFHTSHTVFEHIPPAVLARIFNEGNRIINDRGLFLHNIDYSDHFSHSDRSISAINFLQYSDAEWNRYAGNRYMYMNRLRHDDFIAIVRAAGHRILAAYPEVDERSLAVLRSGSFSLNERFEAKREDVLSTTGCLLVSERATLGRGTVQSSTAEPVCSVTAREADREPG